MRKYLELRLPRLPFQGCGLLRAAKPVWEMMITADGPSVAGDRRAKKQRDCLALTNGGVGDGDDSDGDAEIVIVPGRACCARGRRLAERVEVESERKRRKKEVWRFQGAGWQSTSTSGGTCTSPVQAARFFYRLPVATVQPAWRAPGRSGPSAAVTSDGGATGDGLMDGVSDKQQMAVEEEGIKEEPECMIMVLVFL